MIVHLGLGGFARSHLASYLDELGDPAWRLCGVGLLPGDARVRDGLRRDGLVYPLVLKHADGTRTTQQVRVLDEYLFAPDDPWSVVERMADPTTTVVSLTITEGGYDVSSAAARSDLTGGSPPLSVFGLVSAALARRSRAGLLPFTVMSCDNIVDNGRVARTAFRRFATALDPKLGQWLYELGAFPCSMVDRITPVTTDADRAEAGHDAVVVSEPFRHWVLEDAFVEARPGLEKVGVQVVSDVQPYELMKLRLLNGGHQALAYPAALLGYEWVHDAARDERVAAFVRRWSEEVMPTLPPVPGIDPAVYSRQVLERFANPHVADTVARLCAFASDRIPVFVVPAMRANLFAGRSVAAGAVLLAAWASYVEVAHDVVDSRAVAPGHGLLSDPALVEVGTDQRVRQPFLQALNLFREGRVNAALEV